MKKKKDKSQSKPEVQDNDKPIVLDGNTTEGGGEVNSGASDDAVIPAVPDGENAPSQDNEARVENMSQGNNVNAIDAQAKAEEEAKKAEQAEKKKRRRIRSLKRLSLIGSMLILVACVAGMAIWGILHLKPSDTTIQGQADCEVVRVSGKLAGRVVEIYVKEGQYVQKGQRLAKIYSSTADATLKKAKEMKKVAEVQTKKVERGTRDEIITSAEKLVEQAQSVEQQAMAAEEGAIAAEEIARKTFERLDNLFKEGVVSEQKRDESKAALDASTAAVQTARAGVETAHAGVEAARSQLELAQNGPQEEDKEATKGMENVAEASVQEVEAVLEDEYLVAPCSGEVTNIYPHEGELIIMGSPLMAIAKTDDMWAAFSVREEELNNLTMGKNIEVIIPALNNKEATMRVFYVHDMGSYATWGATKAYGDYDSKTFEVKARPLRDIRDFRPGMSVILKTDSKEGEKKDTTLLQFFNSLRS